MIYLIIIALIFLGVSAFVWTICAIGARTEGKLEEVRPFCAKMVKIFPYIPIIGFVYVLWVIHKYGLRIEVDLALNAVAIVVVINLWAVYHAFTYSLILIVLHWIKPSIILACIM